MASNLIHLFNSARKSFPREGRAVGLSPTTPNDVFLTALLETPTTKAVRRSPLQWAAATSLHIVILATLIIVPLYTTGTIQLDKYADTLLVAPPPPPPATGRAIVPHTTVTRPKLTYTLGKLTAPAAIPKTISSDNAAAAPDLGGVPGGVPGGQPGGSLGGVIGGTGTRDRSVSSTA